MTRKRNLRLLALLSGAALAGTVSLAQAAYPWDEAAEGTDIMNLQPETKPAATPTEDEGAAGRAGMLDRFDTDLEVAEDALPGASPGTPTEETTQSVIEYDP